MVQAINKTQQTYRQQTVSLNENAPTPVYFNDTEPNYIVLQNPTSNVMYVSESANVSQQYYEMELPAGGKKIFVKPRGMKQIYIWHADNIIENVPVISFVDEFNPALIDKTTETVNTQQVTGTVNVATLPALVGGTAHIGEVSVNTLPSLPAGTAHIGEVAVNTLPSIPAGTNMIGSVNKTIQGSLTDRSGTVTAGGTAQQVTGVNVNRKFLFIQNISTTDLWFNFGVTAVGSQPSFKLATGEKILFTEFIPTDLLSVFGATTGQAFTVKEG